MIDAKTIRKKFNKININNPESKTAFLCFDKLETTLVYTFFLLVIRNQVSRNVGPHFGLKKYLIFAAYLYFTWKLIEF